MYLLNASILLVLLAVQVDNVSSEKGKKVPPPKGSKAGGYISWMDWLEAYQFVITFFIS